MPRVARFVSKGCVHHVVARGVNRQRIFRSGYDKARYLKRFAQIAADENVLIHGYCLMENHVHWLLTPTTQDGLARLFRRAHTWWAMTYNRKNNRSGHLFQSRYHSSALSESHYWEALRYVERNPVKAGLAKRAQLWEFSSARSHTGQVDQSPIALTPVLTRRRYSPAEWQSFLHFADEQMDERFRRSAKAGVPLGREAWISRLEKSAHRRLRILRTGRPVNLR